MSRATPIKRLASPDFIRMLPSIDPDSITAEQLHALMTKAVKNSSWDVVDALAKYRPLNEREKAADVTDITGYGAALVKAARSDLRGNPAAFSLIKAGAPLEHYCEFEPAFRDDSLNRPLHWACKNPHPRLISALLSAGADITALNRDGLPPMGLFLRDVALDLITYFAEQRPLTAEERAKKGDPTAYGRALSLMAACGVGATDNALTLIKAGAPLDQKYKGRETDGELTPFDFALKRGNARLARALQNAGADPTIKGVEELHELLNTINSLRKSLEATQADSKDFLGLNTEFKELQDDYYNSRISFDRALEGALEIKLNLTLLANNLSVDTGKGFARGKLTSMAPPAAADSGAAAGGAGSASGSEPDSSVPTRTGPSA